MKHLLLASALMLLAAPTAFASSPVTPATSSQNMSAVSNVKPVPALTGDRSTQQTTVRTNTQTIEYQTGTDNRVYNSDNRQISTPDNSVHSSTVTETVNVQAGKRLAIAPDLGGLSNGPCTGISGGVTIGLPGVSGGIQGSGEDHDCTLRYNIQIVDKYDPDVAREMLADLKGVREARQRLSRPVDPRTDFVQGCQQNWTMACQQAIYGER